MKQQSEPFHNHRKPCKGLMQRVAIRVGRLGYHGSAFVWAAIVAIIYFLTRLFVFMAATDRKTQNELDSGTHWYSASHRED